jgi:uncharacterized protein YdiU (UPF0061 family)
MSVSAGPLLQFDHSYARDLPHLSVPWTAAPVPSPALLILNEGLAGELGIDAAALREPAGVALIVGTALPDGARRPPVRRVPAAAGRREGAAARRARRPRGAAA